VEFWGVVIMVAFGNGAIAQVLLSTGRTDAPGANGYGAYQNVNWAYVFPSPSSTIPDTNNPQLGNWSNARHLRRRRLRRISKPRSHLCKLSISPTTLAAVPFIFLSPNTRRLCGLGNCICVLYQCYRRF
jgi:hypothetical protein